MSDIEKILRDLGIKPESLNSIKFGHGVVGKTSYLAIASVIALGAVGWGLGNDWIRLGIAGLIALVALVFLFRIMSFAKANPGVAMLEGAELIQWRRMDMEAKDGGPIIDGNVEAPPPALERGDQ